MKLLHILNAALWAYDHGFVLPEDTLITARRLHLQLANELAPSELVERTPALAATAFQA